MSISVFFLVLAGAFLHASWNIIVKGGTNKLFELGINALGAAIGAIFILPFLPLPDPRSFWLLALSTVCHFLYYLSMAGAYRLADLTLCYTIMRGAAPIITAFALMACGIPLPAAGWIGLLLLCSGIFCLAIPTGGRGNPMQGILLSLRTSVAITAYTLADGFGARFSGSALSYACWLFAFNLVPINIWLLIKYRVSYLTYLRRRIPIGIWGGLASLASYGIAIWAMTVASIAIVAALRETSVIFGMLLAIFFLGEKLTALRVIAVLLVAAGAILARLG